jgi:chaperone required for assembly of F1-ATPase
MKRFWKDVAVERETGGWAVRLDGRPVKTPARAPLSAPTQALAEAIAEEWRSVSETIDPRALPLTGLANAAIDRVAPERHAFTEGLARYAEADLTCYRADGPRELVARQEQLWDPLLSWARRRYDVDFVTTSGLRHVAQPQATVERLSHAVAALDSFRLSGLSPLVTVGGSLVDADRFPRLLGRDRILQYRERGDERWQLEQWGADAEAEAALGNRRHDFLTAARFLELLEK